MNSPCEYNVIFTVTSNFTFKYIGFYLQNICPLGYFLRNMCIITKPTTWFEMKDALYLTTLLLISGGTEI